ncbi:putative defense protein Hdd11 [Tachysurus vachellii]|uniref:putative defense protein Hdd11 n=1 Tax=Tachysurus vachellii TaxID=175792 RepID=UPI00296AD9F3|nr:putative defense protein Hdd11 [Tachysurus vachellii]
MQPVLFVTVWLVVLSPVTGYPTGAPVARCVDMTPGHNVPSQSSPSPYTIVISTTTFTTNQSIRVTIQGPAYLGLLLQAQSTNTDAVGTWGTPPPNTQYLACSNNSQSAITHSNKISKNSETTYTWIPPDSIQSAFIRATVVANRTTFWVNITSERLSRGAAAEVKMAITPVVFLTLLTSLAFQ